MVCLIVLDPSSKTLYLFLKSKDGIYYTWKVMKVILFRNKTYQEYVVFIR